MDFRRKHVDFMSKKGGHDMTCIFTIGQVGDWIYESALVRFVTNDKD